MHDSASHLGVKIACIQFDPQMGQKALNVERTLALIEEAAAAGARVIVLPELCNTGYMFQSRAEAFDLAEVIPEGVTCQAWLTAAQRLGLILVAGIAERAGNVLFNSAVVLGPEGYIGTFRKVHLWDAKNLYFEPGNLGFPVFNTPYGRIGVAICYDIWFPETFRVQALKGADLVCVPTNWVPIPGQAEGRDAMATILAMAAAHTNSMFVACADRIGTEREQPFMGQSVIVGCTGWPVAGPASSDRAEIIYADIDLGQARRARNWNTFNQVLRDRRPDVYQETMRGGGPSNRLE